MTSDQRCPAPEYGKPITITVSAASAIYPRYSALINGPCVGFDVHACADHEFELLTGPGDTVDWTTVTPIGPPKTVIVGKQVRS